MVEKGRWIMLSNEDLNELYLNFFDHCQTEQLLYPCVWNFALQNFSMEEYLQSVNDIEVRKQNCTLITQSCLNLKQ